ncbi:MAG: cyclic nucleotide-binding domain-containing protein, partial [Acutalibacteraceae bacterium]|nr:cyclic nucleotide-binding domain-containing protein [Acutalibacteraceae bacterium]
MTYDQIATFYRTRMGIQSERSVKQLAECTRFIPRKKGDRLRVAGEEMTSILFLMNGVARTYVIDDDGYESIMGFCYKPGRVCYGAAGVQDKYSLNVEAVTDIDTLELPIANLIHVMNRDPQ